MPAGRVQPSGLMAGSTMAGLIALAWGSLAFGAVYPWAYWPLLVLCAVSGGLGLLVRRDARSWNRPLAFGCALLTAAVILQLVPMPEAAVGALSPSGDRLTHERRRAEAAAAATLGTPRETGAEQGLHPLSVDPRATFRGLVFLSVFSVFLLGATRGLDRHDSRQVAAATSVLGVTLALAGIAQQSGADMKAYGVWDPYYPNTPFGPFINRNHFAGWMLMAIPLSVGHFSGSTSRSLSAVGPDWRNRVLWLSSSSANRLLLSAFGILVMVLSLAMTASRAGIVGLTAGFILFGWLMPAPPAGRRRRGVAVALLLSMLALGIAWTGTHAIAGRFARLATPGETGRPGIWRDTFRMLRHFSLVGSGLNTYGAAMSAYQTPDMNEVAVEAHNDYLQIAAEGGVLLTAPAAILGILFVREARRRLAQAVPDSVDHWIRIGALSGLAAIGIQELVDFSLQVPGDAALFVVLCALAVRASDGPSGAEGPVGPAAGAASGDRLRDEQS